MSKKFKILLGSLVVLLSVGGVFLWQESEKDKPGDYVIQTTDQGKIIKTF